MEKEVDGGKATWETLLWSREGMLVSETRAESVRMEKRAWVGKDPGVGRWGQGD